MIEIRAATPADAAAVAQVRRASWFAAYTGIIDEADIERATGPAAADRIREQMRARSWSSTLVAAGPAVVGFASFGPERDMLAGWPAPVTAAGADGQVAEVYAIYVHPDWWSTGAGRLLMGEALSRLREGSYREVVLWVLERNDRARRFYELAGFTADGAVNILHNLGGVPEVRYRRDLS